METVTISWITNFFSSIRNLDCTHTSDLNSNPHGPIRSSDTTIELSHTSHFPIDLAFGAVHLSGKIFVIDLGLFIQIKYKAAMSILPKHTILRAQENRD